MNQTRYLLARKSTRGLPSSRKNLLNDGHDLVDRSVSLRSLLTTLHQSGSATTFAAMVLRANGYRGALRKRVKHESRDLILMQSERIFAMAAVRMARRY